MSQSKNLIIGIDSSLSSTGYAVLKINKDKTLTLIDYGTIRSNEEDSYLVRCKTILAGLDKVFEKYSYISMFSGIEQPNSFRNGKVTRILSGLYAIIRYFIWIRFDIDLIEVNTIHAKTVLTSNRGAKKEEIIEKVNKMFALKLKFNKKKELSDDNEADAISIAYCIINDLNNPKKETKSKTKKEKENGNSNPTKENK